MGKLRLAALCLPPALLGLGGTLPAEAGGYMRSGGEAYVSTGLSIDFGDQYFDKDGSLSSGDCDSGLSLNLHGEYGQSYYTTLFMSTSIGYRACPGKDSWGVGDVELGVKRRVDPLSNTLTWHASVSLPTSQWSDPRSSESQETRLEFGLHYMPRPDPYDLSQDRDILQGHWNFGIGVRTWLAHLPHEAWAYVSYDKPLLLQTLSPGWRDWALHAEVTYRQSIARTHATEPAVDYHDAYHLLTLDLGLYHPISRHESLGLEVSWGLLGENRYASRTFRINYGKTIPD